MKQSGVPLCFINTYLLFRETVQRGSTIKRMAVRSSPSIVISVNAGTQTKSIPPTNPLQIATAFIA